MPSSFEVHSYMHKIFKHIFPKMLQNNCICVPHGVSAHNVRMESKERKAIQCLGLACLPEVICWCKTMLVCILLTPPLICSTAGIENMFPYSPKSAPWPFKQLKMAENYLLGQQFPSNNTIRDEIQKQV